MLKSITRVGLQLMMVITASTCTSAALITDRQWRVSVTGVLHSPTLWSPGLAHPCKSFRNLGAVEDMENSRVSSRPLDSTHVRTFISIQP